MDRFIRLSFVIWLMFLTLNLSSQDTLLFQNFQDQSFGQFQNIDNDGLELSSEFAGLTGAFNIIPVAGPSDYRAVSVCAFVSGGTADNWLISPEVEITSAQSKLSWTASSLSGDAFLLESYKVLLSTTGSELEDFGITLLEVSAEEMTGETRELDLSSFVGQNIFIAFNHTGTDNYALTLDKILVTAPSSQNSVKLVNILGDRYQNVAQPELSLQIVNTGSEIIQDLIVSGSINGDSGEYAFNDLNILPQDTASISFADLYPFDADKYEIIATITSVNSTPVTDEMTSGTYFMVADPPSKKLVLEEATSTACGWCPEGIIQKENMQLAYGAEVINISVHSDDPMELILYNLGLQNLPDFAGLPSSTLSRETSLPHPEVDKYYTEDFSLVAPLELDIEYDYNSANRVLSVTLSGVSHTSLFEDLHRFSFVLLEDNIQFDAPDFAQTNNFSSEASDIPLESATGENWQDLPNPVPASDMVYNDVVRDVIGGFDGIMQSVANVRNGDSFSYELEYTLSSAFDENEMWLVAMVIDSETGAIVNAAEEQMLFESGIVATEYQGQVDIYPNPATDKVYISYDQDVSEVYLEVYDQLGNLVNEMKNHGQGFSGEEIELSTHNLTSGMYTIKLTIGEEYVLRKLMII